MIKLEGGSRNSLSFFMRSISFSRASTTAFVVSIAPRGALHGLLPHSMGLVVSACEAQAIKQEEARLRAPIDNNA